MVLGQIQIRNGGMDLFGINVMKRRNEMKMSTNELAETVNVTPAMICMIEYGRKTPGLYLARDIAKALNCKIDDLFREE